MKSTSLKRMRKILSTSIIAASLTGFTMGSYHVNAKSDTDYKLPQAVINHLQQDDWSEIQKMLANYYGSITTPLKIADVSSGGYTKGQLMGNGDIGVIAAGVSTTSQQFYFGKNDLWGTTHGESGRIR
ncbi:MAG: hypothetical protein ACJ8MO_26550, partial [Bacillus sp. (in: firmicutes)]